MNNPIRKLRKFFVKPKKMNATAVRNAAASSYDEETDDTKLSGAFVVVLLLHIVAVVGIVAFTKIKENRKNIEPVTAAQSKDKKAVATPMTVAAVGGSKSAQLAPEVPQIDVPAVENNPPKILPSTGSLLHTVKQGETVSRIAIAYGTTVPELVHLNGLKSSADIAVGQTLNLPDKNSLPPIPVVEPRRTETVKTSPPKPAVSPVKTTPSTTKPFLTSGSKTYTIQKGDTAAKIAREHGVSYEALIKANNIKDPRKIQPGQPLKIPSKS